jgi:glyoxylase-like metal-dependent hydrolase (beta-lactamase superfamily II)
MKIYAALNPETITNIYLITADGKNGIIINPGSLSYNIYKLIQSTGIEITKVIITQNKSENTNGLHLLKRIYDAEIYAYDGHDLGYKTISVRDGFTINESGFKLKILETPINSFDSISVLTDNAVFVGNIMQAGSLTAFLEGKCPSGYELEIIKKKIFPLADNLIIYPSLGAATTLEIEKKFNPFFKAIADK